MQNRLVAGATVLIVFIVVLAIVATVLVLRTKNQDDLDKKTSNHLPLPLDYASNEGLLILKIEFFIIFSKDFKKLIFYAHMRLFFINWKKKEKFKFYKFFFYLKFRFNRNL